MVLNAKPRAIMQIAERHPELWWLLMEFEWAWLAGGAMEDGFLQGQSHRGFMGRTRDLKVVAI